MIFAGFGSTRAADFGAASSPIRSIQSTLRRMGLPVRVTGVIDPATVDGVNGVLGGWDDAPPRLASGRLTAPEIRKLAVLVDRYIKKAAGGATGFDSLPE